MCRHRPHHAGKPPPNTPNHPPTHRPTDPPAKAVLAPPARKRPCAPPLRARPTGPRRRWRAGVQGLRKPVTDLSRGCTVEDVVNTVLMTCVQVPRPAPPAPRPPVQVPRPAPARPTLLLTGVSSARPGPPGPPSPSAAPPNSVPEPPHCPLALVRARHPLAPVAPAPLPPLSGPRARADMIPGPRRAPRFGGQGRCPPPPYSAGPFRNSPARAAAASVRSARTAAERLPDRDVRVGRARASPRGLAGRPAVPPSLGPPPAGAGVGPGQRRRGRGGGPVDQGQVTGRPGCPARGGEPRARPAGRRVIYDEDLYF